MLFLVPKVESVFLLILQLPRKMEVPGIEVAFLPAAVRNFQKQNSIYRAAALLFFSLVLETVPPGLCISKASPSQHWVPGNKGHGHLRSGNCWVGPLGAQVTHCFDVFTPEVSSSRERMGMGQRQIGFAVRRTRSWESTEGDPYLQNGTGEGRATEWAAENHRGTFRAPADTGPLRHVRKLLKVLGETSNSTQTEPGIMVSLPQSWKKSLLIGMGRTLWKVPLSSLGKNRLCWTWFQTQLVNNRNKNREDQPCHLQLMTRKLRNIYRKQKRKSHPGKL